MAQWKEFGRRVGGSQNAVDRVDGRQRSEGESAARVEELETRRLLAGNADSSGREFWVAFEPNFAADATVRSLFLSSAQQAQVTVEIPGMAWRQDCIVNPGAITTVVLPSGAYASSDDGISEVGIHVTADQEITIYGLNSQALSTDGFTALPVDVLGNSYMAIAYTPLVDSSCGTQFAVVATADGTNVTITPSVDAGTRLAGIPYVVTLARGEVYQLQSRGEGADCDLSGSRITADRPVAVFSGNPITDVPVRQDAADHLVEQLVPISVWGAHFVTVPLGGRLKGDTFRVLAAEDGTNVEVNDTLVATLSRSQYYEWVGASAQEISTSKPVTVAQYANSAIFEGPGENNGDPFMAIIPPVESSLMDYTMCTPASGFTSHYINVWAAAGTTVLLDGSAIPDSAFTPIGSSGYVAASKSVSAGTHTVSGNAPVGVMLYGWAWFESYGWVGGQRFGPGAPVADLVLQPPTAEKVVGDTQQMTAVAVDAAGQPVMGASVCFSVTGANPTSEVYRVSGAAGRAVFSYTGTTFGPDTVIASTGGVSRTATVTWHSVPVATDQSINANAGIMGIGAVTATNADGHNPAYSVSTQPEHGVLVLQADGTFTYKPDVQYAGQDSFTFWASDGPAVSDPGMVSITVEPPNQRPVIADQVFYVQEHRAVGTPVDVVQAHDPDHDVLRFAIVDGDPDGVFAINPATGLISVVKAEYLDYETMPRKYDLRVEVTDNGVPNLSDQATVTINIADIDESEIGFTLSNTSVPENLPAGTVVGDLSSTYPDAQSTLVYTLVPRAGSTDNADNAMFAIVNDQLVATISFNYEVRNSYSIRIRATDGMTVFIEKAFTISVINVNEAPLDLALSGSGVPEGQPIGTTVGRLSATCANGTESITFALVSGPGADDNASFRIVGDHLVTAMTFNYVRGREYAVRIRATDSGGLSVEKELGIPGVPVFEFGQVDGRQNKNLSIADDDGDVVTFKLSGGGMGSSWGNQVGLINTTAKSVLSISVKRGKNGDGLYHIGDITSDGLLKSVSAKSVVLSGEMLINSLGRSADKAAVSLALKEINGADICVQGLAVSSIAVSGWVTGSRIVTTGSIGKFSAAAMAHSSVLVGVDTSFEGRFAGHDDFTNTGATLGKLTIKGLKRSKGSPSPAYVLNSHISAPSMGSVSLVNVWDGGEPVVHVLNDVGVLKVSVAPLADVAVFAGGTWSKAGVRPALWETLT